MYGDHRDLHIVDLRQRQMGRRDSLNVGGLTPLQLIEILSKANIASKLVGICVSNVAPLLDARGHTQYAVAEALLAVMGERLFEEI